MAEICSKPARFGSAHVRVAGSNVMIRSRTCVEGQRTSGPPMYPGIIQKMFRFVSYAHPTSSGCQGWTVPSAVQYPCSWIQVLVATEYEYSSFRPESTAPGPR